MAVKHHIIILIDVIVTIIRGGSYLVLVCYVSGQPLIARRTTTVYTELVGYLIVDTAAD